MGNIYTRTGDRGESGLIGGHRVRKDDLRLETIGTLDELGALLGVARAELQRESGSPQTDQLLDALQQQLFYLGAELATPSPGSNSTKRLSDEDVADLEAAIDRHEADLQPLRSFILPGGVPAAAQLHLARSICRRAERRLVQLAGGEAVRGELLRYVNRLSDLLFVLARHVNYSAGAAETLWQPEA